MEVADDRYMAVALRGFPGLARFDSHTVPTMIRQATRDRESTASRSCRRRPRRPVGADDPARAAELPSVSALGRRGHKRARASQTSEGCRNHVRLTGEISRDELYERAEVTAIGPRSHARPKEEENLSRSGSQCGRGGYPEAL